MPRESHLNHAGRVGVESNGTLVTSCAVDVTFHVPYRVELGENVAICGNCTEMGNWKVNRALPLTWTPGHVWSVTMPLRPGNYEYKVHIDVCLPLLRATCAKCVHIRADGSVDRWEGGENRVMHVPVSKSNSNEMEMTLEFGQTGISSSMTILRETIVVSPNGEELFRVAGSHAMQRLQSLFGFSAPSDTNTNAFPSVDQDVVHDVRSYPLSEGNATARSFLMSELMLDEDEVKTIVRRYPNLRFKSVEHDLKPWLKFCTKEIGMSHAHIVRLLLKKPAVLDMAVSRDIKPLATYFIDELNVIPDRFFLLLIRRPTLLNRSIDKDIKPKARLLKQLTDLDNYGVGRVFVGCSDLFTKTDFELRQRISNLIARLNLDVFQVTSLLLRYPQLLSMRPDTVARKVAYYTKTLKRSVTELVAFPSCFSFSLEKRVMKRFQYLDEIGFPHTAYSLPMLVRPPEPRFYKIVEREQREREELAIEE